MGMKIAVCILTRNRPALYKKCLAEWGRLAKHSSVPFTLFTVDDASDEAYSPSNFRFDKQVGISRAKNKCIELAYSFGVDHIFIAEDDVYPTHPRCLEFYAISKYDHLCYTFLPEKGRIDQSYKTHVLGNGCLMYMSRKCIDTIGGFDTNLYNKFEHVQYSFRAYASGLIPEPFIDLIGSEDLFYSLDKYNEVPRSLPKSEQRYLINKNRAYYYQTRMSTDFIPFI